MSVMDECLDINIVSAKYTLIHRSYNKSVLATKTRLAGHSMFSK